MAYGISVLRPVWAGFAVLAGVVVALPAAADGGHAKIECGDLVRGDAMLERDLHCRTNPALTVRGHLDLNGFTVRCVGKPELEQEGVLLVGDGASLHNGMVEGCFRAVVLDGRGGHFVSGVEAHAINQAFRVNSDGNRIIDNHASTENSDAFRVDGSENLLSDNMVQSAGGDGVDVRGDGNTLDSNRVTDVGDEGIDIAAPDNEVVSNLVIQAGDDGIQVRTGGNQIRNNLVLQSVARGILVGGTGSEPGDPNQLIGNTVADSEQEGIVIAEGFLEQVILSNTALLNALFDLQDQNEDCDDNLWLANTFGTADPESCIR